MMSRQVNASGRGQAPSAGREPAIVRVCVAATVTDSIAAFYRGQLDYLHEHGFRFTVITGPDSTAGPGLPGHVRHVRMPIRRKLSPLSDLLALCRLVWFFLRNRFDLVQYSSPKAALLVGLAAWVARIPVRIYLLWGTYYVGQAGLARRFFKVLDWLACRASSHVCPDSFDNLRFGIREGLFSAGKGSVVGRGSANGIDLDRFDPGRLRDAGLAVRARWNIPPRAFVFGSVLRLIRDKGVVELVSAFEEASRDRPDAYLLLVGPAEPARPLPEPTRRAIAEHGRIVWVGPQPAEDVPAYYAAMDVFVLPTYREGFGVVNLEAAAMGLPAITTDAPGARESVEPDRTGLLVPPRDVPALAAAMVRLCQDAELRRRLGQAGRQRIQACFEQRTFWAELRRHREELLIAAGRFVRHGDRLAQR